MTSDTGAGPGAGWSVPRTTGTAMALRVGHDNDMGNHRTSLCSPERERHFAVSRCAAVPYSET